LTLKTQGVRRKDRQMELAAVVLISSVILWFVEEATDEHV
jgi:hypothetical protein